MTSTIAPHRELDFYQSDDNFYFVPVPTVGSPNQNPPALVINRQNEDLSLSFTASKEAEALYSGTSKRIFGIFGSLQLIGSKYLLLITRIVKCGELMGESVFRIENIDILPYRQADLHLTDAQKVYNAQYLQMVSRFLTNCTPFMYLSYQYDLSHSLQVRYQRLGSKQGLYDRAHKRFVWNRHLMAAFAQKAQEEPELGAYCIPVILGFFAQYHIDSVNNRPFVYTILSRRCTNGAGTRYFSRGIRDGGGNVSNFIETEQIVQYERGAATSYVQLRGSIPLIWSQYPDLRYKPPPEISADVNQETGFIQHIQSIIPQYETLVMINLVDQKGQELALLQKFRDIHSQTNHHFYPKTVVLENFDFHHECRRNRWDRLSLLMDSLESHIVRFGFFSTSEKDTFQRGVFRANCVDSLDRTNVVQALLAKVSLEQQLTHFGVMLHGERVEDFPAFWSVYRNVWADNADACSIQYAGTPALKTDFTRTGQRRLYGKMQDGLNSAIRYYKNNFEDGFRQDSYDLLLGRYQVSPDEGKSVPCPLARRNMLKIVAFPLFILLALSALFFIMLVPAEAWSEKCFNLLLWSSVTASIAMAMFKYGRRFVDNPVLVRLIPVRPGEEDIHGLEKKDGGGDDKKET